MSLGKIAIVGSGAIGSYYGGRLAQSGEDVTFLYRSDYEHVKEHGLKVQSINGDFHLHPVQCENNSENIGEVDLVIVAWKATANHFAEEVIRPLIGDNTSILTLQNGLGNCDHFAKLFGRQRVIGGLCFVCINKLEPGLISHTASGHVRIGELHGQSSPRIEKIAEAFNSACISCEPVESLEKALWMKLVWNYPFNGLAIAEGGVDTEVLLKELQLEPAIRLLMNEVVTLAAKLGHTIPQSYIDNQIEITYPMDKYRPSSMIDYVEGRPVELEAIWLNPLRVAKSLGVAVPEMEKLAARISDRLTENK